MRKGQNEENPGGQTSERLNVCANENWRISLQLSTLHTLTTQRITMHEQR